MKSLFICSAVIVSTIATSCIYDAPGDNFYRTLWTAEEVHLGPFEVSSLTLEFLCNGEVSVTLKDRSRHISGYTYGTYAPDNLTAILEGLRINIQNLEVTFIEAHRDGNTLFLLWKIEDSAYQFTTTLQRKSSYN
jgi:hypothetical protein